MNESDVYLHHFPLTQEYTFQSSGVEEMARRFSKRRSMKERTTVSRGPLDFCNDSSSSFRKDSVAEERARS